MALPSGQVCVALCPAKKRLLAGESAQRMDLLPRWALWLASGIGCINGQCRWHEAHGHVARGTRHVARGT